MNKRKSALNGPVNVYEEEEFIVREALRIAADPTIGPEGVKEAYSTLTDHYARLLRKTEKITRVGDSNQRKLLAAYDRIESQNVELERARREAELANSAKSDFLARMSHEIRTPINAMLGMTELTLMTSLTPEQQDFLSTVKDAGENLLHIINDLLDFSRIEARRLVLESIDFDLPAACCSVIKLMSARAAEKGLQLLLDIAPHSPRFIRGDVGRLKQILLNLVGNAVKFTENGSVTLMVRPAPLPANANRIAILFSVSDTGVGIPHDKHRLIFDSFSQADSSTTRKYGGTGLGLAICKQLTDLMGGEIGLESAPGSGSTFWFTAIFEPGKETAVTDIPGTEIPDVAMTRSLNILAAEDNPMNMKMIAAFLTRQGHRFKGARNGGEALETLAASHGDPFDLVLMDVEMPVLDGAETTKRIRADQSGTFSPTIPIYAMTAHSLPERIQQLLNTGMNGCLTKPLSLSRLSSLLAHIADAAEPAGRPGASTPPPDDPSSQPEYAVLDRLSALQRLEDDTVMYDKFIAMFDGEIPSVIQRLRDALHKKDSTLLRKHAHYLKGSASMIGAAAVSHTASLLENAARDHYPQSEWRNLIQRIETELARVSEKIQHPQAIISPPI